MYRTGDQARFMEDGRVEFLGRRDFQVKIRGHRIELGEIETALEAQSAVREAVVIAREDVVGEPRLAAYVVPVGGARIDAAALREQLRHQLPAFMIPTHIVPMVELPHTPNMKVDRTALPAPGALSEDSTPVADASGDGVSSMIATAWSEALGASSVAAADNFFDLGGDSLMVIRVHARLKAQLPCELALTDFFRFPTVRDLAAEVQRRAARPGGTAPVLADGESLSAGQRAAQARRAALTRRTR